VTPTSTRGTIMPQPIAAEGCRRGAALVRLRDHVAGYLEHGGGHAGEATQELPRGRLRIGRARRGEQQHQDGAGYHESRHPHRHLHTSTHQG
jgi:hypothetical protein